MTNHSGCPREQQDAISISNNIAEGFERNNFKEFKRFLYYSKASCAEVKSMIYLAKKLKYINDESFDNIYKLSNKILNYLGALIKSIKE